MNQATRDYLSSMYRRHSGWPRNEAYKRRALRTDFHPTSVERLGEFERLMQELDGIEVKLDALGADYDHDDGGWAMPPGTYETIWAESEEEYIARCKELDAGTAYAAP